NDPYPTANVTHCAAQQIQEVLALIFGVNKREYFLELVNDDDQLSAIARQENISNAQQTTLISLQLLPQVFRLIGSNPHKRGLQFVQRVCAWYHVHNKPLL